jgi:predicted ATPase
MMGFLDDGGRLAEAAIQHARTRNSPVSLAWALISAAFSTLFRRDMLATKQVCSEAITLSQEHRLPQWMAFARQSLGWAMCCEGEPQVGIEFQEEAMCSLHSTGSVLHTTRFRLHLAESFLRLGQIDQARAHLNAGFAHLESHGETYLAPELYRVSLLLLSAEGAPDDLVERPGTMGLEIARSHGAHLFELRLATCLSRLWRDQGKRTEARDLLAPIYGWFTEGFDTPDLKEAKALLEELA